MHDTETVKTIGDSDILGSKRKFTNPCNSAWLFYPGP